MSSSAVAREWQSWFVQAARGARYYSGYTAPLIFSGFGCRGAILRFPKPRAANDA